MNPLLEFDPEMERTFHKSKRQRVLLTESSMVGGEANNFELKSALISMVQQS